MHTGARLSDLIASGPLAADRLLHIGTALAEAVAAAHARGESFGALAPTTVFVTDAGAVQVLDTAHAPISARREDDLAALGLLLYAMATGRTPWDPSLARPAVPDAVPGGYPAAPPSPIAFNPRLPSGLLQVIRRGVDPQPAQRFVSAAELIVALREVKRAPGSLESLLPAEHISSSAAVKPPPRPAPDERDDEDDEGWPDEEHPADLPF